MSVSDGSLSLLPDLADFFAYRCHRYTVLLCSLAVAVLLTAQQPVASPVGVPCLYANRLAWRTL
jgi:hypothetical protein